MISNRTSIDQMVVPAGATDRRANDVGAPTDDRERFDDHLDRALDQTASDQRATKAAALTARRSAEARSQRFDERARLERRRLEHRPSGPAERVAVDARPSTDGASPDVDDTTPDAGVDASPVTPTAVAPIATTIPVEAQALAVPAAIAPSVTPVSADADAAKVDGAASAGSASAGSVDGPEPIATVPAAISSPVPPPPVVEPSVAPTSLAAAAAPSPLDGARADGSTDADGRRLTASSSTRTTSATIPPPPSDEAPTGSSPAMPVAPSSPAGPATASEVDGAVSDGVTGETALPPASAADEASPDGSAAMVEAAATTAGSARPVVRHARATGAASAPSPVVAASAAALSVASTDDATPTAPVSVASPAGPTTHVLPTGERNASTTFDGVDGAAPEPPAPPLATTPGERAGHGLPVSVPRLSIDLSDEGLGPLTLQAQQGAGGVHVRLTAGDAAVSDLLARSGAELRRDLEAGGTTLGSLDIGHGDAGQGHSGQSSAAWAGTDQPGDRRAAVAERRSPVTVIDTPVAPTVRAAARSTHVVDGVDVRI